MRKVRHFLLFTYQNTVHPLYWLERRSAFAGTLPSGVHPRMSVEGEARGFEQPQFITQQPDRPKEGEKNFNSSLGTISLVRTTTIIFCY